MTPTSFSTRLRLRFPYDLRRTLFGHGWIDLAPHAWDDAAARFTTACAVDGHGVDVDVVQRGDALHVRGVAAEPLARDARKHLVLGLRRVLRTDVDLSEFWDLCRGHEHLRWVPRLCAGHLMQSPTLFEDLLRLLLTTNCSWAATRLMCQRLCDGLGEATPSGRRAFPGPGACADAGERFFRDVVRAGYRASSCAKLARGFADGTWSEAWFADPELPVDERRRRLLALPGFGPYAVGHALRGLGCHADLALDSWCRARLATLWGRRRPPTDGAVARRYARFGAYRGLALWMDLTAEWHRGAPAVR
jgi:N-glycosylase/DNA lyase